MAATPEEFFAGSDTGLAVYERVRAIVDGLADDVTVRTSTSQVAFRRRRGFAYLWLPGRYLRDPAAEVVLSVALPRELSSPRWKEVAHPSPRTWMHHLEVSGPEDVDAEVRRWLTEAAEAAGG